MFQYRFLRRHPSPFSPMAYATPLRGTNSGAFGEDLVFDKSVARIIVQMYRAAGRKLTKKRVTKGWSSSTTNRKSLNRNRVRPKPRRSISYPELGRAVCAQWAEPSSPDCDLAPRGLHSMPERLPSHIRTEWAKIEGRFRIVHYVEDSVQVYELIAQALKKLHGKSFRMIEAAIGKLAKHCAKSSTNIRVLLSSGQGR